jgi:probable phosphoglycerate mutase
MLGALLPHQRWVLAFRHGQTDWNAQGRIQGHLDVPLNDLGRRQASRLTQPLRRLGAQAVLSSDLSRASETARIAVEPLGLDVKTDQRLREIHLGRAQGKTREELEAEFGVELSSRLRSHPLTDMDVTLLGSETGDEVWRRATQAILEQFRQDSGVQILGVASHGGVLRRLVQFAHREDGRGQTPFDQIGWIGNCAIYPLVLDLTNGSWRLVLSLPVPHG